MVSVNIYKIKNDKIDDFKNHLNKSEYQSYIKKEPIIFKSEYLENTCLKFSLTLYYFESNEPNYLNWNWIIKEFDLNLKSYPTKPKAILLIDEIRYEYESEDEDKHKKTNEKYALSFGSAYHDLRDYSDTEWPLKFAEHLKLKLVKAMHITSPNSIINKKINNYTNFNKIELNSAESLNQIEAYMDLEEDVNNDLEKDDEYFKQKISIGNSIKFDIIEANLDSITKVIDFIQYCNEQEPITRIPYFKEIQNKPLKNKLNEQLINAIFNNLNSEPKDYCINIPEFIINDGNYIFLKNINNIQLIYKKYTKNIYYLNVKEIYKFFKDNKINKNIDILDMWILFEDENSNEIKYKFKNLIVYDNPENSYMFDNGKWVEYNGVYLDDLNKSLSEIEVIYDEQYDFTKEKYEDFLIKKSKENKKSKNYENMDDGEKKTFKRKYYKEYSFNLIRTEEDKEYILGDRKTDKIRNKKIEIADLFSLDKTEMYAVKIGNSSSSLSYVVDQSLNSLDMLDAGELKNNIKNEKIKDLNKKDIKTVYLWIILKWPKQRLKLNENNEIDISQLNYLILKNKIDEWKKKVLLSGRTPKIRINYCTF